LRGAITLKFYFHTTIRITLAAIVMLLTTCTTPTKADAPDYNGYTVVNVKVDGNVIQGDVPAVNFFGRTLVPIRFVSDALGAKVEWNNDTNTATITSQNQSAPTPSNSQLDQVTISQSKYKDDISKLKLYSRITNSFMQINELAKQVMNVSNLYADVIDYVQDPDVSALLANAQSTLSNLKNDLVPSSQKDISGLKLAAAEQGIDMSDVDTMINSLNYALSVYTSASTIISRYVITKDDSSLDSYQASEMDAFSYSMQVKDSSFVKFNEFYGKIQNF
jgi:hypothetical protein